MDKKLLIIAISSILTFGLLVFFIVVSWDYFVGDDKEIDEVVTEETEPEDGILSYEDSPFGFIQGEYGENNDGTPYIVDLGVHWNKFGPIKGGAMSIPENSTGNLDLENTDFTNFDQAVRYWVLEKGIKLATPVPIFVKTRDGSKIQLTHDEYKNFCHILVDRYPVITHWFVGGSEMNRGVGKGLDISERPWKLNEADTAEYVKIGYDCIKNTHPEFRVILGGSSGLPTWQKGGLDEYFYNLVSELTGDKQCPDMIFDYHQGSNPQQFKGQVEAMNIVKETLDDFGYANNDIWTTDVGGSWDDFQGFTEREQAGDVVRRYAYTIAHGQEKLFWTRILEYDWTKDDSSIFDYMGLVNNPRNTDGKDWKKLAYYTYKLMVDKLEGSDWENIKTIQEFDNIYAYKFIKKDSGKPIWVVWWDYFEETASSKTITLDVGSINSVKITEAVPDVESGAELNENDYPNFFNTETRTVNNGKVEITLKESPVFVEVK